MKKIIATVIIIAVLVAISIPKIKEYREWQEYLKYEKQLYEDIDARLYKCDYQIQHRDNHTVYFHGSLEECKAQVNYYELTVGECVIMPYLPQ